MFRDEDCCGFWITTPGRHHLGARRLATDPGPPPDHAGPDALLFDFSDSEWHFGFDGAVEMANAYPETGCCSITGGPWTHPTSHRSTPTPGISFDKVDNPPASKSSPQGSGAGAAPALT